MVKRPPLFEIKVKRVYEPAADSDGCRVLVDRLWPRGLAKSEAKVDLWLKEVAPSPELRRWFAHDPGRWEEFRRRYENELRARPEPVERLLSLTREGPLTLLFAARDEAHNNAVVLKDVLSRRATKGASRAERAAIVTARPRPERTRGTARTRIRRSGAHPRPRGRR